MVSVFFPGRKFTPSSYGPLHQSHDALPALIHEVSAIADGGFRFITMFDSIRRPGSAPIITMRHGVTIGVLAITLTAASSIRGESLASSASAVRSECFKYI